LGQKAGIASAVMRIVWSAKAVAHLIEIHDYIEQDKPEAARRIAQRILASVERLVKHPYLGHPGREPDTRELVVAGTPYIIPYRIYRGRLAVLAVLHGAQRIPWQ
jgi:toxin ParE1/3/4